jgi:hypothetical protein
MSQLVSWRVRELCVPLRCGIDGGVLRAARSHLPHESIVAVKLGARLEQALSMGVSRPLENPEGRAFLAHNALIED